MEVNATKWHQAMLEMQTWREENEDFYTGCKAFDPQSGPKSLCREGILGRDGSNRAWLASKCDSSKGLGQRGLFARRKIRKGEVIFREVPRILVRKSTSDTNSESQPQIQPQTQPTKSLIEQAREQFIALNLYDKRYINCLFRTNQQLKQHKEKKRDPVPYLFDDIWRANGIISDMGNNYQKPKNSETKAGRVQTGYYTGVHHSV